MKEIMTAVQENKCLQQLNFAKNNICDDAATAIKEGLKISRTIRHFDLSNNKLTGKGVKII